MTATTEAQNAVAAQRARPGARRRTVYGFALKAMAGIAVLAFLLWHFELRSTFRVIGRERPLFFLATVLLYLAGQVLSAFRWLLLARLGDVRGRFRDYLGYYFIGMFTNVFVPGLIGGDALRALYLGRREGRMGEAVASVAADRGVGLLTLFWFAAAAVLIITKVELPRPVIHVALAAGAISLLAWCTAPVAARLAIRAGGRTARLLAPLQVYLGGPLALIPAIVLSAILQFSLAICQYLLALGLRLTVPLAAFVLIVPMANVIASVPLTINGLGVRDAAYLVLLGMAGISKADAVALSLLYFAATLVAGLAGIVPFILMPMAPAADEAAGEVENGSTAEPFEGVSSVEQG